jgi:putative aminopeptidase FrvX
MTILHIDLDYLADTLEKLLSIPSPTSYTDNIVRHCGQELDRLGVPFEVTRRGAIRAVLRGKKRRPARAIAAHLDTLGAQVKQIKDNGRLGVVPIGSWSARFAEGARCTIFTEQGSYRGTILPLKASGHTYGEEVSPDRRRDRAARCSSRVRRDRQRCVGGRRSGACLHRSNQ